MSDELIFLVMGGQTPMPPKAESAQISVWEFRGNFADYDSAEQLSAFLHKLAKKFVFQLERGEQTGYEHWQGRMSLWKQKRKPELMVLMVAIGMVVPNYLQPTTNHEFQRVAFYCMKEDTRIGGPWKDTDTVQFIPYQYRDLKLWPYQEQILETRHPECRDARGLDAVVDFVGKSGKSTLAGVASLMYGCFDMPPVNDAEKLVWTLCDLCIAKDTFDPKILFIDLPRALGKDKLYGMYSAIEQIKKGHLYDTRNVYKERWIDSPRVWVFTNAIPAVREMSADRWRFWMISPDKTMRRVSMATLRRAEAAHEESAVADDATNGLARAQWSGVFERYRLFIGDA